MTVSLMLVNIQSVTSNKSSTTSSAQIRAALVARMVALKERHALEEQEQQIKRRKEQLNLEMELAASTAKLVLYRLRMDMVPVKHKQTA